MVFDPHCGLDSGSNPRPPRFNCQPAAVENWLLRKSRTFHCPWIQPQCTHPFVIFQSSLHHCYCKRYPQSLKMMTSHDRTPWPMLLQRLAC